jgi:hypothetical protein
MKYIRETGTHSAASSDRRIPCGGPRSISLATFAVAGILLAADVEVHAEEPFVFAGSSSAADTVHVAASPDNRVNLTFFSTADRPPASVRVKITEFIGESNHVVVPVSLETSTGEAVQGASLTRVVPIHDGELRFGLMAEDLPSGDAYAGQLILQVEGVAQQRVKVVLEPGGGPPAAFVVEPTQVELGYTLTLADWLGASQPSRAFSVQVRNETDGSVAKGIYFRLVRANGPDGAFAPTRHFALTWDGADADAFWRSAKTASGAPQRELAGGKVAELGAMIRNVSAGEYTLDAKVGSVGGKPVDTNQFHITVRVRDPMLLAALDLLIAVTLSYLANKGLSIRRQRLTLRARIKDLKVGWLDELPAILPVVWVRAMLRLTDMLANRFSLAGSESLDKRLDQVTSLLAVLERVRLLRRRLAELVADPMVVRRARKKLEAILNPLDAGPIDDATKQNILGQLTELESWLTEGQLLGRYWNDLKQDVVLLLRAVRVVDIPVPASGDTSVRTLVEMLVNDLQNAVKTTPPDLQTAVQIEHRFSALQVLWHRRHASEAEFAELAEQCRRSPLSTEPLFQIADDQAWKRLQGSAVRLVRRYKSTIEPNQAFEPIHFELECDDPIVATSYLFNHGLRYEWTIRIPGGGEPVEPPSGDRVELYPVTDAPRVAQYAPISGDLSVSVRIVRGKDEAVVVPEQLPIAPSSEFSLRRAFDAVEIGAVTFAALLALISGLTGHYAGNPSFGSLKDYLLLFLWGAGVDQSKNFLMLLNEYSPKSS